jgi:hypothetical protein
MAHLPMGGGRLGYPWPANPLQWALDHARIAAMLPPAELKFTYA